MYTCQTDVASCLIVFLQLTSWALRFCVEFDFRCITRCFLCFHCSFFMLLHCLLGSFLLRLCVRERALMTFSWGSSQRCLNRSFEKANRAAGSRKQREISVILQNKWNLQGKYTHTQTDAFNPERWVPETGLRHAEGLWHSGTSPSSALALSC